MLNKNLEKVKSINEKVDLINHLKKQIHQKKLLYATNVICYELLERAKVADFDWSEWNQIIPKMTDFIKYLYQNNANKRIIKKAKRTLGDIYWIKSQKDNEFDCYLADLEDLYSYKDQF